MSSYACYCSCSCYCSNVSSVVSFLLSFLLLLGFFFYNIFVLFVLLLFLLCVLLLLFLLPLLLIWLTLFLLLDVFVFLFLFLFIFLWWLPLLLLFFLIVLTVYCRFNNFSGIRECSLKVGFTRAGALEQSVAVWWLVRDIPPTLLSRVSKAGARLCQMVSQTSSMDVIRALWKPSEQCWDNPKAEN